MRGVRLAAFAAVLTLTLPVVTATAGPPGQLQNKSIVASWAEDRTMQSVGGKVSHTVIHASFAVYVSAAGRVFSQMGRVRQLARGFSAQSSGSSTGPGGEAIRTSNSRYGDQITFSGRELYHQAKYESGARRITISFDESFRSCTLSIVWGKEPGMPGIVKTGMNRKLYVLQAVSMASPSCAIRDGNVFGG